MPTEVWHSVRSSSSSSSAASPDSGKSRGTRLVQVEMALSSSNRARYRGTWRAMSKTARDRERGRHYVLRQDAYKSQSITSLKWQKDTRDDLHTHTYFQSLKVNNVFNIDVFRNIIDLKNVHSLNPWTGHNSRFILCKSPLLNILWMDKQENFCHACLKGQFTQKKYSVNIYSPLCPLKPIWLTFFSKIEKMLLWRMLETKKFWILLTFIVWIKKNIS